MSSLPAYLAAYVAELRLRYARDPDERFLIVSDSVSAAFLGQRLSPAMLERTLFLNEGAVRPGFVPESGRSIIVTHTDRWAAIKLHQQLSAAKAAGHVVALVLRDRRLQTQPPGWEDTGLSYGGMFRIAASYAASLGQGAYAEFGVFDGHTFAIAWHALEPVCDRFFAFDSFAGIVGAMDDEAAIFENGAYAANLQTFNRNLELAAVDLGRVTSVVGPFQETLKTDPKVHGLEGVSVAHIDVDVYEPAKLALAYLSAVLQQGAILLFDDYDHMAASNDRGERRALKEWLAENPSFSVEPYRNYATFGRSFIFHRGD